MTSEPARKRRAQPAGAAPGGNVVPLRRDDETATACPLAKCDGTGWIDSDDGGVEPCECRTIVRTRSRARGLASAIPARYRGVSFDRPPLSDMARQPESRNVVAAVKEYIDNLSERLDEGRSLWLSGDVGTGKTTLAMLVSKSVLEQGRSVGIYSQARLLRTISATYDGEDSLSTLMDRLASVDLLHIDDLGGSKLPGTEAKTISDDRTRRRLDWTEDQLFSVIGERYEAKRAVVVTTNLDEEELERQIGRRTVSRLVEMCGALGPLGIQGRDNRY